MRILLIASLLVTLTVSAQAANRPILDETGREVISGGYVAITEDRKGVIRYTADDYRRMARMGANFQVVRVSLGRLGGWPGKDADPTYLAQLDDMVRMGKEAGLQTIFKLVVYGINPFGDKQWSELWANTNGCQDALLAASSKLWTHYRHETAVFGYDVLNEPKRGLATDKQVLIRENLLPTLRRLVDALHTISPHKWALYQPLFNDNDGTGEGPFEPMTESLGRDRVIYAPHFYTKDIALMSRTLDRYEREAALSSAPLLIGEWGPSAPLKADEDPKAQAVYTEVYQKTAQELDRRRIGGIKAWFTGSRSPLKNKKTGTEYTWAIFSDTEPVGKIERKFITNPLARARPLVIAGRLHDFGFDYDARTLNMTLQTDASLGATEIFVPIDRYYPAGFRVEIGSGLVLALKRDAQKLDLVSSVTESDHAQASVIRWDADKLRLIIDHWAATTPKLTVKILPYSEAQ